MLVTSPFFIAGYLLDNSVLIVLGLAFLVPALVVEVALQLLLLLSSRHFFRISDFAPGHNL